MLKKKTKKLLHRHGSFFGDDVFSYYLVGKFKPNKPNEILVIHTWTNIVGEKTTFRKRYFRVPKKSGKAIFFRVRKEVVYYKYYTGKGFKF